MLVDFFDERIGGFLGKAEAGVYRLPVAVLLFGIGLTCLAPFAAAGAAPILNTGPPPAVGVLGVTPPPPPPNENPPAATAGLLG